MLVTGDTNLPADYSDPLDSLALARTPLTGLPLTVSRGAPFSDDLKDTWIRN